jgi:hypothetical protein
MSRPPWAEAHGTLEPSLRDGPGQLATLGHLAGRRARSAQPSEPAPASQWRIANLLAQPTTQQSADYESAIGSRAPARSGLWPCPSCARAIACGAPPAPQVSRIPFCATTHTRSCSAAWARPHSPVAQTSSPLRGGFLIRNRCQAAGLQWLALTCRLETCRTPVAPTCNKLGCALEPSWLGLRACAGSGAGLG